MPALTISKVAVRSDGWSLDVTIQGASALVGSGSNVYDFGSLGSSPATTASPTFTVTVVSEGYTSAGVLSTITRTLYGTHVVRKPYPNQTNKDEVVSGSDMVVRVALSESIYIDDRNNGAGTSGTDPVVNISANWFVNGADYTNALTSYSIGTANNASTLAYPKVIAQWAWGHTPVHRRVTSTFDIGCIAYHGHGIACVFLSATDAHAASVSGTVTTKTDHSMSASGLHYESYDLNVPVTSFTEGDDVTLKFIAYPAVGDASSIIDTSTDIGTTNLPMGLTQITCTYKTTGITTLYVSSTGNDTTGDGSSGNPYATVGKALAQSPQIILIKTGSGAVDTLGSTPASVTQYNYCIEVRPESGSITLNRTITAYLYKAKHLRYSGFTIASAGEGYSMENATGVSLQFADCSVTRTGALPGQSPGFDSKLTLYVNCTWDGLDKWNAISNYNYVTIGCSIVGGDFRAAHGQIACKFTGTGTADQMNWTDRTGGLTPNNYLFVNNFIINAKQSGSGTYLLGASSGKDNAAFIGNILEVTVPASSQAFSWFEGSGTTNYPSNNTICAHNTIIGARSNLYYNDVGTVAVYARNAFVRNNAFQAFNIKADIFAPANGNRIGNWGPLNGVNFSDNRWDGTNGFPCDWHGINVSYVTGQDTIFGQLGYTTDNSADGAGTGNGDYSPAAGSVLKGHSLLRAYASFDLHGNAV